MDRPIPTWVLWLGAAMMAAAIALAVIVWLLRRGRRGVPRDLERVSPTTGRTTKPVAFMPAPTAMAADPAVVDNRVAYRRPGNPVLVVVHGADEPNQMFQAWVVDRSRRGLRLAAQRAAQVGRLYAVRPVNAPPGAPWTNLEVRHCSAQDNYWDVGGRFPEPPTMQVLLLFG
jgi:hypothetical protein